MPDSLEHLDLLLVTVAAPRVVHRDGIHFQGLRYLHTTLAAYVRESVTIRYDPRVTSPPSASSTGTGSSARPSAQITAVTPSASRTSRPPAAPTGAGFASRSTNASPW
ncbi:Mu transposase C-terminal domain-containing protein [Rhodococcus zopfii]